MANRKSFSIFLTAVLSASAFLTGFVASRHGQAAVDRPSLTRRHVNADAFRGALPPGVHRKITPPAEIRIELIDAGQPGGPVALEIHAESLVPANLGSVSIKVPQIAGEPERTDVLWSDTPGALVAQSIAYVTDPLPTGWHRFTAIFEFTPAHEGAKPLLVAESLCLDVRPDTILSSTVSFAHIKRIELLGELQHQYHGQSNERLAHLMTTSPDVAHRITELNRVENESNALAEVEKDTATPLTSGNQPTLSVPLLHGAPPAQEVSVPVRLRDMPDHLSTN